MKIHIFGLLIFLAVSIQAMEKDFWKNYEYDTRFSSAEDKVLARLVDNLSHELSEKEEQEEISILVNAFKKGFTRGSWVNHEIRRSKKHYTFNDIVTFVKLAYTFENIENTTDHIVWNGRKILPHGFSQNFESVGCQEKNRLDIIVTEDTKYPGGDDEPPFETIIAQKLLDTL